MRMVGSTHRDSQSAVLRAGGAQGACISLGWGAQAGRVQSSSPCLLPQHLYPVLRGHALSGPAAPQLCAQHPHHDQRHCHHDDLPGRALQVPLLQGEPVCLLPACQASGPLMQQPWLSCLRASHAAALAFMPQGLSCSSPGFHASGPLMQQPWISCFRASYKATLAFMPQGLLCSSPGFFFF